MTDGVPPPRRGLAEGETLLPAGRSREGTGVPGPARPIDPAHWQRRLDELARRFRVPGATLGILRWRPDGDELVESAHGVLNTNTGVQVTTDSLFQIGSITKVWTATLAMQLVDEGLLTLDAPIVDVLPELRLADPDVTEQVTLRHLLTHTSGIDGDVFTDTGRGGDCLERYVELLADVAQNHPLGATFSYCNSGFSLVGRVIEKLTGTSWDEALRSRLCAPLGLQRTVTLAEEAILHRAAVGHPGDAPKPTPVWSVPRSAGPAGGITATVADVLAFARMHLRGGVAADGTRVLSGESVAVMADRHADLPDTRVLGDSWGLGWIRFGWDGHRLVGHDGNTIGQSAFLRVLAEQGLAVALLTNGGGAQDLYLRLFGEIFAELAGVAMPAALTPVEHPGPVDVSEFVGVYERAGARVDVFVCDGAAMIRHTTTGPLATLTPDPIELELSPADTSGCLFVIRRPGEAHWTPVTFYSLPTDERYVHFGLRATPKVG